MGNSGSTGERIPEVLSSDSKEVLAMANSARPIPICTYRLPWGSGFMTLFPHEVI